MFWAYSIGLKNKTVTVSKYKMITDEGNGFFGWNGKIYQSDIVRAAIRPKASNRKSGRKTYPADRQRWQIETKVNPDAYMRFLLEEPNPYMTQMHRRSCRTAELNNNAFAYSKDQRLSDGDISDYFLHDRSDTRWARETYLRFTIKNGKTATFRYSDIIHLRKGFQPQ